MTQCPLNTEQQVIIERIDGAYLVLAPVGTGKTRVLAERALHAIQVGISADRILCLTFTNRAAEEMRSRLTAYDRTAARRATIKTFHGLCALFLRAEARHLGLPADFVIYDEIDSQELIAALFDLKRADSREARDILGRITNCKIQADLGALDEKDPWGAVYASLGRDQTQRAVHYQETLHRHHALDFADLILFTRFALIRDEDLRRRWLDRYDFIQVDEVQDTHRAEYEIVATLARQSRNIAFFGDIDQTIYGWRGSEPESVIAQYRADFTPQELQLTLNYRATRTLLRAADSFARSFSRRYTAIRPSPLCEPGERIRIHHALNPWKEGEWIADQIHHLFQGNSDFRYHRIAVLARTNNRAKVVSDVLRYLQIPCITVDAFEFFRRQEIKDALAYLRLLTNPHDGNACHRVLLRPTRGISPTMVEAIRSAGEPCGLRLTDMLDWDTIQHGDPFWSLMQAYTLGDIVVFDVETTGLTVEQDEIVELAAARLHAGKPVARYHAYLRSVRSVGNSESIHGLSDAFLAEHGRESGLALSEFFSFCQGAHLVGHNVGFDLRMVAAQARRLGLVVPVWTWSDTLDLSVRFVAAENHKLETLARLLDLSIQPTHQAGDDVETTMALLAALMPMLRQQMQSRQQLVARYGPRFAPLAQLLAGWRERVGQVRPAALLAQVMEESGLIGHYAQESRRQNNLNTLLQVFQSRDIPALHPEIALRSLLEFTSLAHNIDLLSEQDNQVVAITIHQAKGLEFDTVFIAGAVDDELPIYFCIQDGDLEEEKHLFYVALTRAKRRLFISGYRQSDHGWTRYPSRFIRYIDASLLSP